MAGTQAFLEINPNPSGGYSNMITIGHVVILAILS